MVFGLVHLLGAQYRPALADIPDQKGWRIQDADYGSLSRFARGRIDLDKIRRHWGDILRVVVSIYSGEIRAHDLMRMIQRDGNPTPLDEAIAHYGRIFKTPHILTYAVEEPYRRDIKGVRNLQRGGVGLVFLTLPGYTQASIPQAQERMMAAFWRAPSRSYASKLARAWQARQRGQ
ncbi:Tn3 family transposase [Nonomuraea sp. NPDC050394]|uniref:Tn3 family transposase n=1 Tax=Nonomuraea sp. NPDC050394 TaxID=3364363 RepID=UPI00379FD721